MTNKEQLEIYNILYKMFEILKQHVSLGANKLEWEELSQMLDDVETDLQCKIYWQEHENE